MASIRNRQTRNIRAELRSAWLSRRVRRAGRPAHLLFLLCFVWLVAGGTAGVLADPIAVRYPQGTSHGFLLLRTEDGKTIAVGDSTSVVHGGVVTSRLVFHFKDGSLDDDQVMYTQSKVFRLLHEHHVQRGPTFPKSTDIDIDAKSGTVITHEPQKNGQDKVNSKHIDFPPDLANGILLTAMENLRPSAPPITLSLVVPFDGARLIHLTVSPAGTVPFRVGEMMRRAQDFLIKVDLGGVAGVVAPVIGKQPKDLHFLIYEGAEPAFVEESGQFFEDGPVWRIEQVGAEPKNGGSSSKNQPK